MKSAYVGVLSIIGFTEVSGRPIGPIFKGQECLTFENRTESLCRNYVKYQSTLCNIQEE